MMLKVLFGSHRDAKITRAIMKEIYRRAVTKMLDEGANIKLLGSIWGSRLNDEGKGEEIDIEAILDNAKVVGNVFARYTYGINKIFIMLRKGIKLPLGAYVFVSAMAT